MTDKFVSPEIRGSSQNLQGRLPQHVAIIMDGNGRWATDQRKPRTYGHMIGAQRVRAVVEAAGELGIGYLTLFAFSEENWRRPDEEVTVIMRLIERYLVKEGDDLVKKNVRFKAIGDMGRLPPRLLTLVRDTEEKTRHNSGLQLNAALSYGARTEIVAACRRIAEKVKQGQLDPSEIDVTSFAEHLWTAGIPEPDLVIRTSGERRLSNFLLWQSAYSELHFSPVFWPEFDRSEFDRALRAFCRRERRFGDIRAHDKAWDDTRSGRASSPSL